MVHEFIKKVKAGEWPPFSSKIWHRNYYEMIMEMTNSAGNLAASEERNRFVLDVSDQQWVPYVTPGGMLDRLVNSQKAHRVETRSG